MRQAYRLVVCLIASTVLLIMLGHSAEAKTKQKSSRKNHINLKYAVRARPRYARMRAVVDARLYGAIQDRIGLPYRSRGIDDRGYDCSGFVWRVFQEAGIDFERSSARTLWRKLPEADEDEEVEFGTLVFFKGLDHVGIMRDAYSFYHVSNSQGVVRSFFSEYWEKRVVGFRKIR